MNIESKTKKLLGVFALILFALYAITSSGFRDMSGFYTPVIGFTIVLIIIIEGALIQYYKKSPFKKLDIKDGISLTMTAIAGILLLLSIAQLGILPAVWNASIQSTVGWIGGLIAVVGAILSIVFMWT